MINLDEDQEYFLITVIGLITAVGIFTMGVYFGNVLEALLGGLLTPVYIYLVIDAYREMKKSDNK